MKTNFSIGQLSALFQIPIKTLRYYDEIGLFKPVFVDKTSRYRYYSTEQFEQLHTIQYLKILGMPLKNIRKHLETTDMDSFLALLKEHKEITQRKITELSQVLEAFEGRIEEIELAKDLSRGFNNIIESHRICEVKDMKYTVTPEVFALNPDLHFGILVGENMINSHSSTEDSARLRRAEELVRKIIPVEELRNHPNVLGYRTTMERASINPNKFSPSIEAMLKRVLKGSSLPDINSLVDLCNAVSLETQISLGGHDLRDMPEDLAVRFTDGSEKFLPFGATEYEVVEPGELVFTSGNVVQTRKWVWRQSELGKMNEDTNHVFFQLVGFEGEPQGSFHQAVNSIEALVKERFGGTVKTFIVTKENPSIEF